MAPGPAQEVGAIIDEPDLASAKVGEAGVGPACAKGRLQRGLSPNRVKHCLKIVFPLNLAFYGPVVAYLTRYLPISRP